MDLTTTVERMPVWGETVLAAHFETSFGGKGANQAVAAAKLGAEVVMVTNFGDDTLGDSALKNFESYGIDTRHVRRIPNQSTGTATILVDREVGRQFDPHCRGGERRSELSRRRRRERGAQGLRSHPAAARDPA